MRKVCVLSLCVILGLAFIACGSSTGTTWQEQYDLGMQYLTDGDYEAAIVAFTAAIEIDAKDIQAYTGLIQAYIGTGDYESAVSAAEQGAKVLDDSGQDQVDSALEKFTAALLTLGELCLNEGQYELAISAFSIALEINPELVDAYIGRAEVYVTLSEAGAASDGQDAAVDESETAGEKLNSTGDGQEFIEDEADEMQKALEDYQKALELIREGEAGSLTEAELEELIKKLEEITAIETDNTVIPTESDDTITTYLSGNVMQSYDGIYDGDIDKSYDTLPGNDQILRESIRSITILNTLEDMPDDAWDISENGDGSVMAWVMETEVDEFFENADHMSLNTDFYDFYIAGEGGVDAPENSHYLFGGYENAWSIDLSFLYTGMVTDMSNMFELSTEEKIWEAGGYLEYLDISGFDTSNVKNMSAMFYGCYKLCDLDIGHFDTENVTDMSDMFFCCGFSKLNISNFNTSKVTDMSRMFLSCNNLVSLDVSSFNTDNVTDMSYMFQYCTSLTALDVSNFNTSKVTNMEGMFDYCINLKSLNISGFDFSSVGSVTDYSAYLGLTK